MSLIFRYNPFRSSALALGLAAALSLPGCAAKSQSAGEGKTAKMAQDPARVLAVIDGKALTEGELTKTAEARFQALDLQYEKSRHDLLEGAVRQEIGNRLLDAETKATGKTRDQLAAELKPAPVTDAEVDAFYEQNKGRAGATPKEQLVPQIRQYLAQQRAQQVQRDFLESLWKKYKVELKLDPFRVEVAATGPAKGPQSAPVTIVEFSDFQCPYCRQLVPTLDQVHQKYGDKVRIVFRQFPLPDHPAARKAAEAALCANEQGKFWELHDQMFNNQQALAPEQLKSAAATLGLNAATFNQCLDSGKTGKEIEADVKAGVAAGVQGTPTFFVNGRSLSSAMPLDQISVIIDEELKKKGS
jgi:protein-disulfide isomerase